LPESKEIPEKETLKSNKTAAPEKKQARERESNFNLSQSATEINGRPETPTRTRANTKTKSFLSARRGQEKSFHIN
jgi:hypothetical protein